MGHKAHPIGLRLGIHRKWRINWYFESKNYTKFLQTNFYIENFIKGFLFFLKARKTLVLQTQLIKLPSNVMFIFIFYYRFRKKWKKTFFKKKKENSWRIFLENYFLKNNNKILISKNALIKKTQLQSLKNILNKNQFFINKYFLINQQNIFFNKKINYKNIFFKFLNILKKIQFLKKYYKNLKKKKLKNYLIFLTYQSTYLKKYIQFTLITLQNINLKNILKKKFFFFFKIQKLFNFIKIYSNFNKKNLNIKFNLQKYFLLKKIFNFRIHKAPLKKILK